jgi:SAM-dependent methyltransferase
MAEVWALCNDFTTHDTSNYRGAVTEDATVNAGDIARLGGVGRAAVSNWRRRHPDFPRPVAGTPTSPRYALADVEEWLHRNGKTGAIPVIERVWQRLCAEGGEIGLGHVVARVGALLVWLRDGDARPLVPGVAERADATFVELVEEAARRHGHAETFELLHTRYLESRARRLGTTPPDVAALMIELADAAGATVLDPACGTGTLLLAAGASRALGQEIAPDRALIAAARLRLHGTESTVVGGDSLRRNAHPDARVDIVVCDPPFGDRGWGRDELAGDPRWAFGVPPRGEPELAWVQHCLALLRPGGRAVLRMPAAAASRRGGRRIRASLLRNGALRAVVGLSHDADLWVLRRPEPGAPAASRIVLCGRDDAGGVRDDLEAGRGAAVGDLLDDDVDVRPPQHAPSPARAGSPDYDTHAAAVRGLSLHPPALVSRADRREFPTSALAQLERAGFVTVLRPTGGPATGVTLTGDDLAAGSGPTGPPGPSRVVVRAMSGDVVTGSGTTRVLDAPATLGPGLIAYRVDPERLDPEFLAGVLRVAGPTRAEQRRARVPQLPIETQRAYGHAFRELADLLDGVRDATERSEELVVEGVTGLLDGWLDPG